MITKEKIWTYEEYLKIEEEGRYEILKGQLLMAPAPNRFHQRILGRLFNKISFIIETNKMGQVYLSPIDVVLREDIVLQPDLVIVLKENYSILQDSGIIGIPDIVIEIISPSSVERDIVHKKKIYEECKVKEYWIVFPREKIIEIFTLKENQHYEIYNVFSIEGNYLLKSFLLKDLEINLKEIFEV
jgi:Uma2 family endonuclease